MKIIIDIPEEDYHRIASGFGQEEDALLLEKIFKDGTLLDDVLDKIRAEIETKYGQCDICEYFEDYDYEENDISEYRPIGNIADILQIIDKYKAGSEVLDADSD